MASATTLTILLGFATVFFCLEHLEAAAKIRTSQGALAGAAAGALLPAVLAAFGLTLLLLVAHVRALGRADAAAAGAGAAGLGRLGIAALAATSAALLAGAVVGLVAD